MDVFLWEGGLGFGVLLGVGKERVGRKGGGEGKGVVKEKGGGGREMGGKWDVMVGIKHRGGGS